MQNKPVIKRALAYFIDVMIVTLIVSLFSGIEALNPYKEKYEQAYKEYQTYYSETLTNKESIDSDRLNDITYDITKYSLSTSIMSLVASIVYFVFFQYYNRGRTIGKAILGITIVNDKNEPPTLKQVFIRALIINSLLTNFLVIMIVLLTTKSIFLSLFSIVQFIDMILIVGSICMILIRKDVNGIHDMISKTQVINNYMLLNSDNIKEKIVETKKGRKK